MTVDTSNGSTPTVAEWLGRRMPQSSVSAGAIASVALVRVGVWPFRGADSHKERDAVLHELFAAFPNAFLVAPDSPDWRHVIAANMSDSSLNLNEGSWTLLLRADDDHSLPPRLNRPGRTDVEIDQLRQDINGTVFVIAWEDNIEWTVSANPERLARLA